MVATSNKILQTLTGKAELEAVTVEELEAVVQQHPYFAAAHFLLAKKLQQLPDAAAATAQIQKTAVYFPNTFWLDHLLNHTDEVLSFEEKSKEPAIETVVPLHDVPVEAEETTTEPVMEEAVPVTHAATTTLEDVGIDKKEFAEHLLAEEDTETAGDEAAGEEAPLAEFSPGLSKILAEQAAEFSKPVEENAVLPVESEPYYTVDYFDSQGIKLDPSQLGKDKLGRKVRKFTDWLKDMKKNNTQPGDLGTDPEMEQAIQTIAAASNETREIVTESMAEVLIKQGKTGRAVKLYEKLSFLNPDKSAYFAAKISQIKGLS